MHADWQSLFGLTVPFAELVVRGSAMFLFLWLLFRLVIKRRVGAIGMADLLVLVIIADAAQNAMAGEYTSISDGMVLVGTIVAWNYALDWLGFRYPALQRLLEPPPLLVVEHGPTGRSASSSANKMGSDQHFRTTSEGYRPIRKC